MGKDGQYVYSAACAGKLAIYLEKEKGWTKSNTIHFSEACVRMDISFFIIMRMLNEEQQE